MPLPAAQVGTWESHHLGQNRGGGTQQLLALEPRLLDSGQKHRSLACHPFNSVPSSNLRSRKYLWNPSYQKNLTNTVSSCFISAVQEGWIKSRLEEMLNELIYYNCHTPPCPLSAPPPVHAANTSRCLSFEAQLKGHLHFSFLIPCRPSSMSHLYLLILHYSTCHMNYNHSPLNLYPMLNTDSVYSERPAQRLGQSERSLHVCWADE